MMLKKNLQQTSVSAANENQINKVEWAKVTLNGKIKRIYNPSQTCLNTFVNQVQSHFKELNEKRFVPGGDLAMRQSVIDGRVTQEDLVNNYFQLKWQSQSSIQQSCYDQPNTEINILSNEQFEEIMAMHAISEKQNIPRFTVSLSAEWMDKEFASENKLKIKQEAQPADVDNDAQLQAIPDSDSSSSSSDDEDQLTKQMVQKYIRQGVRKELNKMGPAIFQKLMDEHDLRMSCCSNNSADEQLVPFMNALKANIEEQQKQLQQQPEWNEALAQVAEQKQQQEVVDQEQKEQINKEEEKENSSDCDETQVIRIANEKSEELVAQEEQKVEQKEDEEVPEPMIEDAKEQQEINKDPLIQNGDADDVQKIVKKGEEEEYQEPLRVINNPPDQQNKEQEAKQANEEEEKGDDDDDQHFHFDNPEAEEQQPLEEESNIALNIASSMNIITANNQSGIAKFFQNLADKISDDLPPQVQIINDQSEVFYEQEYDPQAKTSVVTCSWTIKNPTSVGWPEGIQLVPCVSIPQVKTYFNSKMEQLSKESTAELITKITIPAGFSKRDLTFMFRLRDNKQRFFGPSLVAFIKLILPDDVSGENKVLPKPSEEIVNPQQERSSFDQVEIHQIIKDPNSFLGYKFTEEQLLAMSSILLDEGYGTFDRCLYACKVTRGDITRTKQILSNLMITEGQFL